ncbi:MULTISPECIES: vWA domain-containing protein [unclassified Sphingomonas]|uniref:vWA domain-containing protein n=1 Tax=unclassified Sphingomonas TaxID=196159 RepID=UPI0009E8A7CA|nr:MULTISPECIES: VWA domain-containing protein [unclassified Sphingomonas]
MTSVSCLPERLTRACTAVALLALCPVLAGCDRKTESADGNVQVATQTAGNSPEIDAYLNQFSADDPEACFNDPALVDASFRSPETAIAAVPPARVIVAIDASGSMAGRVSSRQKLELAKSAAAAFVEELPATADAGLLVFGQAGNNRADGKAQSCAAVDLPVPMTRDRAALVRAVSTIRPVGWTPLAAALKRAEVLLAANGRPGEQIIYVVSDGQETCGGDPIAVARSINQGSTKAIINIIGFAVPSGEAASLQAVAAAGGGRFVNAGTDREIDATVARIREDGRKAANRLAQSGAVAQNRIAASGAAAKARICASGLVAKERIAVSGDIAKKRIAGKDVALEERAEKVLAERHAALERRAAAFVSAAEAKGDRANEAIDRNAALAR